jgi:hypothetical protein
MAKISLTAVDPVPISVFDANREYAHGLGCIELRPSPVPLAIVGGGPSVSGYIQELQNFDGEIWAINDAIVWCQENGINARFYTVDPDPNLSDLCANVKSAILGDTVSPAVFDALDVSNVELVTLRGENGLTATISSAATALFIATERGHAHVTFYGCEGSFVNKSHIYGDKEKARIWVDCGGVEYTTSSDLLLGAEFIGQVAALVPTWITARDDGLLSALIEHGDYDVTFVSPEFQKLLDVA